MKDKIGKTVFSDIDYKGVFSVISDGLKGERSIKDTVSGVVQCISKSHGDDTVLVSAEPVSTDEKVLKTLTEDEKQKLVADFLESKNEFNSMELPAKTTYEMPELSIECVSPMSGTVTSAFGYRHHPVSGDVAFHYGMDIGGSEGDSIASFADGTVISVSDSSTYGKNVTIAHDSGVETMYAHCSEITVKVGDAVKKGNVIAKCGSTGNATSACLHLELIIDGVYVNPGYYI